MRLFGVVGAAALVILTVSASAANAERSEKSPHRIPLKAAKRRNILTERVVMNHVEPVNSLGVRAELKLGGSRSPHENLFVSRQIISISELSGGIFDLGYYAQVKLGGQAFKVEIDTGSPVLAVPVDQCATCPETAAKYSTQGRGTLVDCSDSNLCRNEANLCADPACDSCSASGACCSLVNNEDYCLFSLVYGDNTGANGSLIHDTLELVGSAGLHASVVFGGIFEESSGFEPPAVDGILGVGPNDEICVPNCMETAFSSLVSSNDELDDIFALCLTRSNSGSILGIGGAPAEILAEPLKWFPFTTGPAGLYYLAPVASTMYVGDSPLEMNSVSTSLVDSGTTLLNLPSTVMHQVERMIEEQLCDEAGLCAEDWIHGSQCYFEAALPFEHLPTLRFELVGDQNMMIELEPQVYTFESTSGDEAARCIGFEDTLDRLTFGVIALQKYATVFDRAEKRVGFATAAAECGSLTPVVETCTCSTDPGTCLVEIGNGLCDEAECMRLYCDLGGDMTCEVRSKDVLKKCDQSSSEPESGSVCCTRVSGTVVVQNSP